MARTVAQIQQQLSNELAAQQLLGNLTGLTSPSMTALYRCWIFIQAVTIAFFEQLLDAYQLTIEQYAAQTPSASALWVQAKVFKYQYDPSGASATNVATILPDFTVGYQTVNSAFNIVTRCSVVTTGNNAVSIKVAQSSPPAIISGAALTQLDSYLTSIIPAGVYHTLFSGNSDQIAIYGTVYYLPGYGGVAQTNVEAALKAYLDAVSISNSQGSRPVNYQGIIKVSEIINTILTTEGVADVEVTKISCRAATTIFANATLIYDLTNGIDQRVWNTVAGHAVQETTGGSTWSDTLSYTSE